MHITHCFLKSFAIHKYHRTNRHQLPQINTQYKQDHLKTSQQHKQINIINKKIQ